MNDLAKILNRAIADPKFAETVRNSPEEAMKQTGIAPTPEKVQALRNSVKSLQDAHATFSGMAQPD
jgi:hypothetical protein